jgi:ferritin-like metal-binding protein YciE
MAQQKTEHKLKKLEDLFEDVLKDIYDAENQIVKAMPKMIEAANSQDLKNGFKEHLEVTRRQSQRLEQIFSEMKKDPKGKKCVGMQGLIKEGDEIMKEAGDPNVLDAGLIAAAQKIEHYEISSYGTARAYAQALGHQNFAGLLNETLQEEGQTDKKLTAMAEGHINAQSKR